jgi:glycosyltransferase involved in cell wall biosynthesis
VIPAHNEERHIASVVDGLPDYVDVIIVVDDASTDGTSAAASSSARKPMVVRHERNQGVGAAVIDGYLKALESDAEIVGRLDGDGQMDPSELSHLLDPLVSRGAGFSKGNRFKLGRIPETMPLTRKVGNIGLTFLTKLASGYWHLFDPQNGYSAITADAIGTLDMAYLRRCGYFFENGLLIELNSAEVPAVDVPTSTIYGEETSGLNIGRILVTFPIKLVRGMFRRLFQRYVIRDFSAVAVFLLGGSVLFTGGLVWGITAWARSAATGLVTPTGSVMLAALPMLAGFELLLQAIVLDINGSPR